MKKIFLCFLICLIFSRTNANEGMRLIQDYGNVRVNSYKDFEVEEFRKAFIIGQLAKKLADELQYTDSIYLDFHHNNDKHDSIPTVYHTSVERFSYSDNKAIAGTEKIVIRQYAYQYDFEATLKLLVFVMKNKQAVRERQNWKKNPIQRDFRYFISLSDAEINTIIEKPSSTFLTAIMHSRIDRPVLSGLLHERKPEIDYYWQDKNYHVYRSMRLRAESKKKDAVIISLPNIYTFEILYPMTLVFDSPASFYCIHPENTDRATGICKASPQQVINDTDGLAWGKQVTAVSHHDVAVSFTSGPRGSGVQRLLLYFSKTNTLVQNTYSLHDYPLNSSLQNNHSFGE